MVGGDGSTRRAGGTIADCAKRSGQREGARKKPASTLLAVQSLVVTGEDVAAKALIEKKIADELASVWL